jgi:hypothetical protein
MKNLNALVVIAVLLIIVWIGASVTRFLAGALLNLLLVIAVILLIVWGVKKLR